MKFLLSIIFIGWIMNSFSQKKYTVFNQEKKKGLKLSEAPFDTVVSAKYKSIFSLDKTYIFCDKIKYGKNNTHPYKVKGMKIADDQLKELVKIDKAEIYAFHTIDHSDKTQKIYRNSTGSLLLENIEVIDVVSIKKLVRYSNDYKKNFYYLILFNDDGIYKVINQDHEVFTLPFASDRLIWDEQYRFFHYGDKKDFAVYTEDFELMAEHISFMNKMKNMGRTSSDQFWVMGTSSGKQQLFQNQKLVKEIDGEFFLNYGNTNRFVYKKDDLHYVIDSSGINVVDTAYQKLYPSVSREQAVNLVQNQSGEFYFVDHEYRPISNERFESAEPLSQFDLYTHYKVQFKGQKEEGFHLYNFKGQKVTDEWVEDVYESDGLVIAKKKGKKAFLNWDDEWSAFGFDKISLMQYSEGELVMVENEKGKKVFSLNSNRFLEVPKQYKKIEVLEDYYPRTVLYSNPDEILLVALEGNDIHNSESFQLTEIDREIMKYLRGEYGFYFVKNEKHWGILGCNNNGFQEMLSFEHDEITLNADFFDYNFYNFKVKKDGKTGLVEIGNEQNVRVPIQYDDLYLDLDFVDMSYNHIVYENGTYYGIYDIYGKHELTPPIFKKYDDTFDAMDQFLELYAEKPVNCIVEGKKKACIFSNGIACFDKIEKFDDSYEEYFIAENNKKIGLISYYGDTVVPVKYDHIDLNEETDIFIFTDNGKKGLSSFMGDELLETGYDEIEFNSEWAIFKVNKNGFWGIYDPQSDLLITPKYNTIVFYGDHYLVEKDRKWGAYIFGDTELTVPLKFDSIEALKEHLEY